MVEFTNLVRFDADVGRDGIVKLTACLCIEAGIACLHAQKMPVQVFQIQP